ncbi:MAG: serine hydrolase [Longimicrobiales bacterium]
MIREAHSRRTMHGGPAVSARRRRAAVVVLAFAAACAPGRGSEQAAPGAEPTVPLRPLQELERAIRQRIEREGQGEVSVVVTDLATGQRLGIGEHTSMHAASTMKVPILLELFRQDDEGRLSIDDEVPVVNEFRSLVGDTLYSLSAGDDSDSTLYARVGESATMRELARLMIVRSSNLATNILIGHVRPPEIAETLERIGAEGMKVRRGVEDGPAYRKGLNNTTTAQGLARVLEAIGQCAVTTREACDAMVEILAAQEFNEAIPAGLPAGTRVAHKTGWITEIQHDGAIIYPPDRPPYVLVVLTRGIMDTTAAARVGADISRLVWDALTAPDYFDRVWSTDPQARRLAEIQAEHRVEAIIDHHFTHESYWTALAPYLGGDGFSKEEVGRSAQGRAINLLSYGSGPTTVLLWSQMHGDESTATMALADIARFLAEEPDDERARQWLERLTLLLVPMVNPDGAERFVRHNAHGIDINRDARSLVTPEAQTLKAVRDRHQPAFGFNLHDQNARTRVGRTERTAAIALLPPAYDAAGSMNDVREAAIRVAATVRTAIEPLVHGHITRYDDTFNPRAFGDLMQQWGTSTVLIESGGFQYDPEKQYLRTTNFVAMVTALDAIASGDYAGADPTVYTSLPQNSGSVNDLLISGGTLVVPGLPPARADIAADFDDAGGDLTFATIDEIGDLAGVNARDTVDASGLFVHATAEEVTAGSGPGYLLPGMRASFVVRQSADPESTAVYTIDAGWVRRVR